MAVKRKPTTTIPGDRRARLPGDGGLWDYLKWRFPEHPLYKEIHSEWVGQLQDGFERVIANRFRRTQRVHPTYLFCGAARHSLKTTITSQGLPEYAIARDPNLRIELFSEDVDNAAEVLALIKATFEEHKGYRERFGDMVPHVSTEERRRRWTQHKLFVAQRTDLENREPSVSAQGVARMPAGQHFDIRIVDDPHPRGSAFLYQTTWKAIEDSIWRLEQWGMQAGVATPWGAWDYYSRTLKLWAKRLTFPPVIRPGAEKIGDATEEHPNGLFRSLMPRIWSDRAVQDMADHGDPFDFACQMLLNPIPDAQRRFHPDNFIVKELDWRQALWVGMILDPTGYADGEGSEDALIVFAWMPSGHFYLIDCWAKRGPREALFDKMADWTVRYRPARFGIEKVPLGDYLEMNIRRRFEELSHVTHHLPSIEALPSGQRHKTERIQAWITDFNRRLCIFNPAAEHLAKMRDQILGLTTESEESVDLADAWGYVPILSKDRIPTVPRTAAEFGPPSRWQRFVEGVEQGHDLSEFTEFLGAEERGSKEGMRA